MIHQMYSRHCCLHFCLFSLSAIREFRLVFLKFWHAKAVYAINYLSVLVQVQRQRFNVIVKAKRDHRVENIFSVYCFSFLILTSLTCLRCDERNELWNTFLDAFTRIFGNLKPNRFNQIEWAQRQRRCTQTFPFSGIARFIILAMLAIGKNRSCSRNGAFFECPCSSESSEQSSLYSSLSRSDGSVDKLLSMFAQKMNRKQM